MTGFSPRSWPLVRQFTDGDLTARGTAVRSARTAALEPRIDRVDTVAPSICPYCAVGCGQLVYAHDGEVVQIEGDPASPISRGRLCPKGSASLGYVNEPAARDQGQVPPAVRHASGRSCRSTRRWR